eukprot:2805450-Rhodomonas_salina.1
MDRRLCCFATTIWSCGWLVAVRKAKVQVLLLRLDALCGLEHVHLHDIEHCDVSPATILLLFTAILLLFTELQPDGHTGRSVLEGLDTVIKSQSRPHPMTAG